MSDDVLDDDLNDDDDLDQSNGHSADATLPERVTAIPENATVDELLAVAQRLADDRDDDNETDYVRSMVACKTSYLLHRHYYADANTRTEKATAKKEWLKACRTMKVGGRTKSQYTLALYPRLADIHRKQKKLNRARALDGQGPKWTGWSTWKEWYPSKEIDEETAASRAKKSEQDQRAEDEQQQRMAEGDKAIAENVMLKEQAKTLEGALEIAKGEVVWARQGERQAVESVSTLRAEVATLRAELAMLRELPLEPAVETEPDRPVRNESDQPAHTETKTESESQDTSSDNTSSETTRRDYTLSEWAESLTDSEVETLIGKCGGFGGKPAKDDRELPRLLRLKAAAFHVLEKQEWEILNHRAMGKAAYRGENVNLGKTEWFNRQPKKLTESEEPQAEVQQANDQGEGA